MMRKLAVESLFLAPLEGSWSMTLTELRDCRWVVLTWASFTPDRTRHTCGRWARQFLWDRYQESSSEAREQSRMSRRARLLLCRCGFGRADSAAVTNELRPTAARRGHR